MTAVKISKDILNKKPFVQEGSFFESCENNQVRPAQERLETPAPAQRAGGSCPYLDTPTPPNDILLSSIDFVDLDGKLLSRIRAGLTGRNRRLFSRSLLGMYLPGRYYWLTFTSSKESPALKSSWMKLRRWLMAARPGIEWIYCFTDEGYGVIHMIIRLKMRHKHLKQARVKEYWEKIHRSFEVRIKRVKDPSSLAEYFADQRIKKKMAGEIMHQPTLKSWHASRGWLPVGFTRAFGRVFHCLRDQPPQVRDIVIKNWLLRVHKGISQVTDTPFLVTFNGVPTIFNSQSEYQGVKNHVQS